METFTGSGEGERNRWKKEKKKKRKTAIGVFDQITSGKKKEVSIENDEFSDQTIHNETWTDSTKPTPVG